MKKKTFISLIEIFINTKVGLGQPKRKLVRRRSEMRRVPYLII